MLTLDQVADLTVRQITFLYYRERDKDGKPKPLPYYFKDKQEEMEEKIAYFRMFGTQLGKTPEEIEQLIEQAKQNGNI